MASGSTKYLTHLIASPKEIICGNCSKKWEKDTKTFSVCSACKQQSYCSVECQKAHWNDKKNSHKLLCNYYREKITFDKLVNLNPDTKGVTDQDLLVLRHALLKAVPKGTTLISICEKTDPWDWHRSFSNMFKICQRLGCFRQARQIHLKHEYKKCEENERACHEVGIAMYCSQQCKNGWLTRKAAGSFWPNAIGNQLTPNETHENGNKVFKSAYSQERQEKFGALIDGKFTCNEDKLYPLRLFAEFMNNQQTINVDKLLSTMGTTLDMIELSEESKDCYIIVLLRIAQIIERLDYAKWPFIGTKHDLYTF